MKFALIACTLAVAAVAASCGKPVDLDSEVTTTSSARGALRGRVRVTGIVPANDVIRMNADPMCLKASGGSHVADEAVIATEDGGLSNVFVELVGTFPDTPVPAEPVFIDQRRCLYSPRVVGLRAGQALQIRNSDDGLHNVHGMSGDRDGFNVSQPSRGLVNTFRPHEPGVLRLKCDVHTWMMAFVGVVNHPYFAVTGADGTFALRDVPEGTYELKAWHERLGTVVSKVRVNSAREANVEMTYPAQAASTQ